MPHIEKAVGQNSQLALVNVISFRDVRMLRVFLL